jgi:hypothetical protein
MNYTVQYTDARWKASSYFAFAVEIPDNQAKQFVECQRWLAKTYGASVHENIFLELLWQARHIPIPRRDAEFWQHVPEVSRHWCYRVGTREFQDHRIYLRDREELNFFQLRFAG